MTLRLLIAPPFVVRYFSVSLVLLLCFQRPQRQQTFSVIWYCLQGVRRVENSVSRISSRSASSVTVKFVFPCEPGTGDFVA